MPHRRPREHRQDRRHRRMLPSHRAGPEAGASLNFVAKSCRKRSTHLVPDRLRRRGRLRLRLPRSRPVRTAFTIVRGGCRIAPIVLAVAVLGWPGSASATLPALYRVYPPGRAYSLLLPSGWRFRNASYPSDHATHLWWTPADPLARAVVVLSGCAGCVSTNNAMTPNPRGAASGAASTSRIGKDEIAFSGPYDQAEPDYPDNGIVIVTESRGRIDGYVRIDLWLPPSRHALARAILNSFRLLD